MAKDIIVADKVTKRFNGLTAVDNISFTVKEGEIFAFLGPNGAGKSTTLKMLTTLLQPTDGKLQLGGHDVTEDRDWARKTFGIVFQDPSLDEDLTAYENMELHAVLYALSSELFKQRVKELMELVGLWERRNNYVKTFSGGMKRRLEIARGLLHRPKVLFLDEPTLGLDTQTRRVLWDYVHKLSRNEKMTILFTTHYLDEAEDVADRIAIIDHGKLVITGTLNELKKQTKAKTLEEIYLKLTGETIRDEDSNQDESFRSRIRTQSLRR